MMRNEGRPGGESMLASACLACEESVCGGVPEVGGVGSAFICLFCCGEVWMGIPRGGWPCII